MLNLTPRTFGVLTIALGEPFKRVRGGLLIPATINGETIELSMIRLNHLSCRP